MVDTIYKTLNPSHLRKLPSVPSYLQFFLLDFDKTNSNFLHPFLSLWEIDFRKRQPGGMSNFPLPRVR